MYISNTSGKSQKTRIRTRLARDTDGMYVHANVWLYSAYSYESYVSICCMQQARG